MGSPVSHIVCNLYMEYFEQQALARARQPSRLWRHYVDDTYTIIIMTKAHAQEFTEYLNTVDADLKWTTEGEVQTVITEDANEGIAWDRVERALAFLDTWSVLMGRSRLRGSGRRHTQTSISISQTTTLWNTR